MKKTQPKHRESKKHGSLESVFIYGRHAVLEAVLKRPDVVKTIFVENEKINELPKDCGVKIKELGTKLPGGIARDAVHQGFVAEIDPNKLLVSFKDFKNDLEVTSDTAVLVLGEIEDTHNVGAIIRSAAAFGIKAVLLPEYRQAPINATAIKVSTGTAFSLPLVLVKNVNNALRDLKEMGFWVYGLDMDGGVELGVEDFKKPSAFVVGNEGRGMREKTAENCDTILNIKMSDKAESLNASVSAAVVMYAWSAKHKGALE